LVISLAIFHWNHVRSPLKEDPLAEHQNRRGKVSENFCRGVGVDAAFRRDRPVHLSPDQNDPGLNFRPHKGLLPDDERSLALNLPGKFPIYLDASFEGQLALKFASFSQDRRDFFWDCCLAQSYSFLGVYCRLCKKSRCPSLKERIRF